MTVGLSATGRHAHLHLLAAPAPGNLLRHQLRPGEQSVARGAEEDESDGGHQGADLWNQVFSFSVGDMGHIHGTFEP